MSTANYFALIPRLQNFSTIMATKKNQNKQVMIDGMMTFDKTDKNLHIADFQTYEHVEVEPFCGKCKVQAMRRGNVYIEELPKRKKNKPMFRQDHSSLSHGRDHKYYFYLSIAEEDVAELPSVLVNEASEAASKLIAKLYKEGGKQV